jgi:adenylosuccinate synthase
MLYALGADWDKLNDFEVCYVTRTYFTRHGAGAFPTECDKSKIADDLIDLTNHYNEFQGEFRYGYFDKELFHKALNKDIGKMKGRKVKRSLAVTHLDKTGNRIIDGSDGGIEVAEFAYGTNDFDSLYLSAGMSRSTVRESKGGW